LLTSESLSIFAEEKWFVHCLKTGVSHTPTIGVSHTCAIGVSHTCFGAI